MRRCRPSLVALLSLLPACAPAPPGATPPGVLVIGLPADVGSLDQHYARSALDAAVSDPLSLPLFSTRFADGRLEFGPGLATHWALDGDRTRLDLTLRPDSTWSDGQPVTAQDVAFTFALLADPAAQSRFARVAQLLAPEGGVAVADAQHLTFHLAQPVRLEDALAQLGGVVILPEHLLASISRADLRGHDFNRAPVLNGCWRLASWEAGRQIEFAARPWGEGPGACTPALDRVVFRIVPDATTRLGELGAGRLDLVADVRVQDLPALRAEHPELAFVRRGPRSLVYVGWNLHAPGSEAPHPLFGDVRVRRVLAQAVDVDRLIQDLFADPDGEEPLARRAVGTVTPALAGLLPEDTPPLPFDPDAARTALAEAGWADTDGDGVLDRNGLPFRFELLENASGASRAQVGVALQADLAAVGVKAELLSLERAAYFERLTKHDFDAEIGGWSGSLYVDPRSTWRSGPDAAHNYVGYASPEVDALIGQAAMAPTSEEAHHAWRAMQAAIYADQPYLFLFWADEIVAVHSRFQDVQVDLEAPWRALDRWRVAGDEGTGVR
ncbi:MAG: ABC transporter substrate-binding protein [Pseudomonadota bacterium]